MSIRNQWEAFWIKNCAQKEVKKCFISHKIKNKGERYNKEKITRSIEIQEKEIYKSKKYNEETWSKL
jgi:invasion protein IalB